MATKALLSIFISTLSVLTVTTAKAASPEERYFETRDSIIRQIEETANPVDDSFTLDELRKQMTEIIGSVDIEGFPNQGRINLLPFLSGIEFAQLDGLRFDAERESLIVTTEDLLQHYLSEHPELPKEFRELSRSGDFMRRVFHADAGVAYYAEIPVEHEEGETFRDAFLGITSQDIGAFIPNEIFVFVSTGNRIFIANAPATNKVTDIPECKREWEEFHQKGSEALKKYHSSQLKDNKAFDDYRNYEEKGFNAYLDCFAGEARKQPFFELLRAQAQSLIDRILRNTSGN